MLWIGVGAALLSAVGLVVWRLWRGRRRYRIVPLEEPLTSRYAKRRCVYYRTEVVKVMRDGRREVVFEEERSINFITLDPEGLPVSVELKPKKVYERFVRARHLSPDPFAYMCKERPLILDDTLGIVIREWAVEVG